MNTGVSQALELAPLAPTPSSVRRPTLVVGVAVLTLFFVPQTLQLVPWLDGFPLAKLTALIVLLHFLSSRDLLAGRARLHDAPQIKCLIGILAFALVTVPIAVWPAASLGYVIEVYAKNVIFAYLLLQGIRINRDLKAITVSLALGCSILVLAILSGVGPLVTYKTDPGRLSVGGSYDPNDLALLFVITIPFAFFMIGGSRRFTRAFLIAAIALMLLGMFKTESRGGFLGLIVVAVLIFLRGSRQARKQTIWTILLGLALFAFVAPRSFWNRINTMYDYKDDYNLHDDHGRIAVWANGIHMIAANPLTGVGIDCFAEEHAKMSPSGLHMAAHNSFLQIAAEIGVPGLVLFLSIIGFSVVRARRIRIDARAGGTDPSLQWFASAVETAFCGFVVSGFFLSHAYTAIFCFLTGAAGALVARDAQYRRSQQAVSREIDYV